MCKKHFFLTALLSACIATVAVFVYAAWAGHNKQYAFVDVIQLTQSYKLKTDLDKQAQKQLQSGKNTVDSLQFHANMADLGSSNGQAIKQQYLQASYRYQQEIAQVDKSISEQVWARMNPLINEFSKERHLKLLVGATGTGTLLYGDSTLDMTNQLIEYINKKYENK